MKVYYLEENLKKAQENDSLHFSHHPINGMIHSDRIELSNLKLQLEEKQIELEQRNILLVKAKSAIEALKSELSRQKGENSHHHDMEDRVRRLKQLNDDMEADYRGQIIQLENQLTSTRQVLSSKEKERSLLEERVSQLDAAYSSTNERFSEVLQDKEKVQDQQFKAQQHIAALQEDLAQSAARLELFKIQLDEESQERDMLKEKIRDTSNQYEAQLRTIRHNHEQVSPRSLLTSLLHLSSIIIAISIIGNG
jgi:chromosome segregation ATPase